jgi:hypothetical protein
MARVWNSDLDPRDYRLQQQQEEYEGPLFKQMMKKEQAEPLVTPTGMQGRQYDPARHAKKNLNECNKPTYYN